MSEVRAFKMVSGEEVVAEVLEELSGQMLIEAGRNAGPVTAYRVRRPHILQFQPMGQGQLGLAFVPWTLSNPTIERIDIPAAMVLMSFSPSDRVERQYLEQTSGISLQTLNPSSRISS